MTQPLRSDLIHSHAHSVRFECATSPTPTYRASCICGWSTSGTLEQVQSAAATHDLDSDPQS